MADTIGRGVIEIAADARGFKAQMAEARKSIAGLGKGQQDATARSSRSIDNYIAKLKLQNATMGKSAREAKLFELAVRGASDAQLKAADAALRFREAQERNVRSVSALRASSLGLSIGFIATASSLVRLSDEYTKYTAQLRLATVGEEAYATAQADVRAIADAATADLASVGTLYARIAQSTRDLGLEQAVTAQLTETIALALKSSGASAAESASAMLQISQAFAAGALRGEEFNAVAEAAPRLLRALADGLGVPVGALKQMATDGKLTSDVLARELPKALQDLRREAASVETVGGAIQQLRNRMLELIGTNAEASGSVKALVDVIKLAADNLDVLAIPIQTLIVLGGNFAYVWRTIGIAIAGVAEQANGFARGGLKGFQDARKIVSDILEEERRKFDDWERSVMSAGRAVQQFAADAEDAAQGNAIAGARGAVQRNATATATGRTGTADNSAERLARAQLQARLDEIRRGNDAQVAEYARAGRLLEARRAADLISEREAFDLRRTLIELNVQAQAKALTAEIDILKRRTFAGKDAAAEQIENATRIADIEARLARAREEAATEAEALSIAERGRNLATARTLDEARRASDAYIISIQRRNALEVSGIGRGNLFRDRAGGEADIESRFIERRQQLESELRRGDITRDVFDTYLAAAARAYQQDVALYRDRNAQIDALQADWRTGATEALQNYADEVRNVAATFEDVFTRSIRRTEDALTEFLDTGKLDVNSFAAAISSDLNRAFVRERITGPLAESIKGGNLLDGILGIFGVQGLGGTQAPAPVVERSIGTAVAGAADGAAFTASVASAGASFTAAAVTAGTSLTTALTAAATALASTITAAGASFAASVSAASVGGGGGEAGALDFASLALDSFATGTPYVPRTGLYQLHQGERVVPAAENAMGGGRPINLNVSVAVGPGADRRTAAQMGVEVARSAQRELARGTA